MSNAPIVQSSGTAITRDEFGARQIEQRRETATSASSALATASINARYIVAERRPRDWDDVRVKLLKECKRTSFAARAIYSLPRGGKKIEGLTVRFAEAMIRTSGNVAQETRTLYDDPEKRLIKVSVTDLESNACYERDVVIDKTVERSKPGERVIISQRMNSANQPVYIVQCTDDELLAKEGAIISKTFRTLSLRFLPADIIEECNIALRATLDAEVKADPDAARKAIADAFASIGVQPSDVKAYLGHDLATSSPAELSHLRGLYAAIRDGEVTWADALSEKTGGAAVEQVDPAKVAKQTASGAVADRIRKRQEAKATSAAASNEVAKGEAMPADPLRGEAADAEPPDDVKTVE